MSRDPARQTTDLEHMQEQAERNERWLTLYNAAREWLKSDPNDRAARILVFEACEALETPR